jgi:riboflavin kinase/FMN adenylyltransferase
MLLSREELTRHAPGRSCAATVGVFDGVHLGHRHLIDQLRSRAAAHGLAAAVVTLHPDPVQVLRPDLRVAYVTSLEERIELLQSTGVDAVAPLTFTSEVAELSARDFVAMLHETLDMRFLLMGPDHAFGRGREGTPQRVAEIAEDLGFEVEVLPAPLEGTSGAVSSTAVRRALAAGDMELVASLLGRPHAIRGPVVRGNERGRTIGFPTANIALGPFVTPAIGVYAVWVGIGSRWYMGAANVGSRPTVGGTDVRVEAHVFDFSGDLYGQIIRVALVDYLRPELKFSGLDELKARIAEDSKKARAVLEAAPRLATVA